MILDLCSQGVSLEMSKGAKKFLFDMYEEVVSLIRHKTQKLLFHPSCTLSLACFLSISYGVLKHVPFLLQLLCNVLQKKLV